MSIAKRVKAAMISIGSIHKTPTASGMESDGIPSQAFSLLLSSVDMVFAADGAVPGSD